MKYSNATTIDEYIAQQPDDVQKRLNELRALFKSTIPKAIEDISYEMPAYRAQPGKRAFAFFAATNDSVSVYALHFDTSPDLQEKIKAYQTTKSTLKFPNDKPLPLDLLEAMLLEKRAQYGL